MQKHTAPELQRPGRKKKKERRDAVMWRGDADVLWHVSWNVKVWRVESENHFSLCRSANVYGFDGVSSKCRLLFSPLFDQQSSNINRCLIGQNRLCQIEDGGYAGSWRTWASVTASHSHHTAGRLLMEMLVFHIPDTLHPTWKHNYSITLRKLLHNNTDLSL